MPNDPMDLGPAKICSGCNAVIHWVKTAKGKWTPVNPDGSPHWSTCPKAKQFKKKGR
jgi:hypothetical protein